MENVRGAPGLLDYLAVLQRRKWLFAITLVLVPVVTVTLSQRQTPRYAAAALVLVDTQATDPSTAQSPFANPDRVLSTDAKLARIPAVAALAVRSVPAANLTVDSFLRNSSVSAQLGTDFLNFSAESTDPQMALKLTNAYARAFTRYQQQAERSTLLSERAHVELAISKLKSSGGAGSAHYRDLVEQERELDAQIASARPISKVSRPADTPYKVAPRTLRNAVIAVFLGLLLAVMVAFVADALDPRVRSAEALRSRWGLPLLGELPRPPRRIERNRTLVMLADPTSHQAERFRVLRASLEFANAKVGARAIVVTSAVDGEGKSTTVGNLAVAIARAGKRVVLIDADLRNPSLHRLFALAQSPGLVDVALGDVELADILRKIELGDFGSNGTTVTRRGGTLEVLPAGQPLHDPDRLGADGAVARIADALRHDVDLVLIDAPPLLPVGDTIALSAHVDALLLVSRLKMLNTSAVERTRRILEVTPAAKLGFILTGTEAGDDSQYPYYALEPMPPAPVEIEHTEDAAANGAPEARQRGRLLRRSR